MTNTSTHAAFLQVKTVLSATDKHAHSFLLASEDMLIHCNRLQSRLNELDSEAMIVKRDTDKGLAKQLSPLRVLYKTLEDANNKANLAVELPAVDWSRCEDVPAAARGTSLGQEFWDCALECCDSGIIAFTSIRKAIQDVRKKGTFSGYLYCAILE